MHVNGESKRGGQTYGRERILQAGELLWFINSRWDFESYEIGFNYVTELPYDKEKGQVLTIPDGLSKHLVKINKAKEFWHRCEWEEDICVND